MWFPGRDGQLAWLPSISSFPKSTLSFFFPWVGERSRSLGKSLSYRLGDSPTRRPRRSGALLGSWRRRWGSCAGQRRSSAGCRRELAPGEPRNLGWARSLLACLLWVSFFFFFSPESIAKDSSARSSRTNLHRVTCAESNT